MDVHIIEDGVVFELHVAMRFLIVDIAIMSQRTPLMSKGWTDMTFHVMRCNRSYVHSVVQNRTLSKFVSTVVCAWENTSARIASCLMMIYQKSSITAVDVEFAELVEGRIFSIALNAAAVTLFS